MTRVLREGYPDSSISTHTPLAGRDGMWPSPASLALKFLLTRPSRDVTAEAGKVIYNMAISTHTPLAGRDGDQQGEPVGFQDFYSHAPRGT